MLKKYSHDTSLEAHEIMEKMYSGFSDEEKLIKCASFLSSAKRIIYSSITQEHPNVVGVELDLAVFRRIYKDKLSEQFILDFEHHYRNLEIKKSF